MKLSTLIIIGLLAVIAWPQLSEIFDLTVPPESMATSQGRMAVTPVQAAPAPVATPRPARRVSIAGSAAVSVRGVVVEVTADGALIDCEARSPHYDSMLRGLNQSGLQGVNGASTATALLNDQDAKYFGHPQILTGGAFRDSEFVPPERARGVALVEGVGKQVGAPVHIVAARVGRDSDGHLLYTAGVTLTSGAWMWSGERRNPLER